MCGFLTFPVKEKSQYKLLHNENTYNILHEIIENHELNVYMIDSKV